MTDHSSDSQPAPSSRPVSACCAPAAQQTCCEPSEKAGCCGTDPHAATCGCS